MWARVAIASVVGFSSSALADVTPQDAAAATALFEEGRVLIESGKIEPACEKFEASLQLDPQIGTKLNLAECRDRQGRYADAYVLFVDAAGEANRTNKDGREQFARQRLAEIATKIVHVKLAIAEPDLPGLTVKLGSRPLARAEWTTVQIVNAGTVVVEVSATDRKPARIERAGAGGVELAIVVPVLEPLAPPIVPQPERPTPTAGRSITPWIVMGTGGVLLLASVGVGLHARSRYNDAADRQDVDDVGSAQREADIGTAIAIGGAVTVAVGVYLYVRSRGDGPVVAPSTDGRGIGMSFTSRF